MAKPKEGDIKNENGIQYIYKDGRWEVDREAYKTSGREAAERRLGAKKTGKKTGPKEGDIKNEYGVRYIYTDGKWEMDHEAMKAAGAKQAERMLGKIGEAPPEEAMDYTEWDDNSLISERDRLRANGEDTSAIQKLINERYRDNPEGEIAKQTNAYNESKKEVAVEEAPDEEAPAPKMGVKLAEADDEVQEIAQQITDETGGDEKEIVDKLDELGLNLEFFDENDNLKKRKTFAEFQKENGKSTGDWITLFSVTLSLLTGGMTPIINGRNLPGIKDEYNAWCELYDYNKQLYEDTQEQLLTATAKTNQKEILDTANTDEAKRQEEMAKAQSAGSTSGQLGAQTEDVKSGDADARMQQELKQYALQMDIDTGAQKNLAVFQNDLQKDMYAAIQEMDHEQQKTITEWANENADIIAKARRGEMGISEAEHALNMTAKAAGIATDGVAAIIDAIIPG